MEGLECFVRIPYYNVSEIYDSYIQRFFSVICITFTNVIDITICVVYTIKLTLGLLLNYLNV